MSEEETNETPTPEPEAAPAVAAAAPAKKAPAAADSSERPLRKARVGVVASNKMTNTIVVEVTRRVPHPQFKKIVKRTSKFYAHDAEGKANEGDKVRIVEIRPMSKLKRWRLVEVLDH